MKTLLVCIVISTLLTGCNTENDAKVIMRNWINGCAENTTVVTIKDNIFMAECKKK